MTTFYVLAGGEYSDYGVYGVFASADEARVAVAHSKTHHDPTHIDNAYFAEWIEVWEGVVQHDSLSIERPPDTQTEPEDESP